MTEKDFTLGFLVGQPHLLEAVEIPPDFSHAGPQRAVWAALQELRKNGAPIQLVTIAEKSEGNGVASYLAAITSGLIPITPVDFRPRVLRQQAEDMKKQMQSLAAQTSPDLDELAALVEEARRLELADEGELGDGESLSVELSSVEPRAVPWLWQDFIPARLGDPHLR